MEKLYFGPTRTNAAYTDLVFSDAAMQANNLQLAREHDYCSNPSEETQIGVSVIGLRMYSILDYIRTRQRELRRRNMFNDFMKGDVS